MPDSAEVLRMRVLVVDDDPSIRTLLCEQLRTAGEQASAASDAGEALGLLALTPVDVVISDVMMPGMSGWDLLAAIRSSTDRAALPVVLLSARDGRDDVRTGYERGASAVLSKPYDFDELHLLLTTLTRSAASSTSSPYPQAASQDPVVVQGLPQH